MARRTKLTPETQRRITDAIALGATYELAAKCAGVAYDTLNEWRKAKPAFSEALEEAEGKAAVKWLERIDDAAFEGDWRAAAWKLERRYPRAYGRTVQEQEISGGIDIMISQRVQTVKAANKAASDE
jgi:transposase